MLTKFFKMCFELASKYLIVGIVKRKDDLTDCFGFLVYGFGHENNEIKVRLVRLCLLHIVSVIIINK